MSTNLVDDEDLDIPGEPVKLLVGVLFLGFGLSSSTFALAMTHDRVPKYPPLPDIILDNCPYQSWGLEACEWILILSTISAGLVVLFHKHR